MKNKVFWIIIGLLIIVSLVLVSCNTNSNSSSQSNTTVGQTSQPISSSQLNWWDKFGSPKYGGAISLATNMYSPNLDVTNFVGGEWEFWYEALLDPDWTLDRQTWPFVGGFVPDQYWKGNLVESWEQTDSTTITAHLRKNVYWQNKPPVNGRELTSDDVVQHYDRIMGTGSGYNQPNPMFVGTLSNWEKVTAIDKYTVIFKFKTPCAGVALQSLASRVVNNCIEPPESVKEQGGTINDWTKVVGSGPWVLTDFVAGNAVTYSKNTNYWGNDPRHTENQVPYLDRINLVIIPDINTQLASLRTGKIDIMPGIAWQQAKVLQDDNPNLQHTKVSAGAWGVLSRVDKKPFSDINVRKALQLSINRKAISDGYYGGTSSDTPSGIITPSYKGYAFAYNDWPKDLRDEYNYNPTKAKELLSAAGYPNGFDSNIVANNIVDLQLLQVIQAYFKDINVNVTINTMDFPQWEAYFRAGKVDQMTSFIGALYTQEPTRVIDEFYSKSSDVGMTGVNDSKYDAIRDRFWSSGNADEASLAMHDADKYIIEQHWLVLATESFSYIFWQPYLKGYSGESQQWGQGITYARLWLNDSGK